MSASDMARAAANSAGRVVTGGRVSGEVSGGGDDVTGGGGAEFTRVSGFSPPDVPPVVPPGIPPPRYLYRLVSCLFGLYLAAELLPAAAT